MVTVPMSLSPGATESWWLSGVSLYLLVLDVHLSCSCNLGFIILCAACCRAVPAPFSASSKWSKEGRFRNSKPSATRPVETVDAIHDLVASYYHSVIKIQYKKESGERARGIAPWLFIIRYDWRTNQNLYRFIILIKNHPVCYMVDKSPKLLIHIAYLSPLHFHHVNINCFLCLTTRFP